MHYAFSAPICEWGGFRFSQARNLHEAFLDKSNFLALKGACHLLTSVTLIPLSVLGFWKSVRRHSVEQCFSNYLMWWAGNPTPNVPETSTILGPWSIPPNLDCGGITRTSSWWLVGWQQSTDHLFECLWFRSLCKVQGLAQNAVAFLTCIDPRQRSQLLYLATDLAYTKPMCRLSQVVFTNICTSLHICAKNTHAMFFVECAYYFLPGSIFHVGKAHCTTLKCHVCEGALSCNLWCICLNLVLCMDCACWC